LVLSWFLNAGNLCREKRPHALLQKRQQNRAISTINAAWNFAIP
jgi:hypothetical protein